MSPLPHRSWPDTTAPFASKRWTSLQGCFGGCPKLLRSPRKPATKSNRHAKVPSGSLGLWTLGAGRSLVVRAPGTND
jgi:hypothetical protein